jgi:methionyl-tRNA formyltransferase
MYEQKINFAFFGTPDVSSETLEILKNNGYLPSLIVTSPDKPQGRKMLLTSSPAKNWAIKNNIPFTQPEKIGEDFTNKLSKENFDLFIVVAYGKILPENFINIPKFGSINIHYSLLPRYRGASPVESAILNGDKETGVSIQKMEYKMDSGPIIALEKIEILPNEKSIELRKRLIVIGATLLIKTLPDFMESKITLLKQDENDATYCKKIKKEDGLVDINIESAENLYNKFRAYFKWPRIFFFQEEKRIIITDAALENQKFVIKKVLPEGKKEINYSNFLNS